MTHQYAPQHLSFTREEIQATDRLAAIELTQISLNAVRWREHRRLNATYTMILVADISKTGDYFCYAGDAMRLARLTDLSLYYSVFAGKRVECLSFPPSFIAEVVTALNKANVNVCFVS